MASSISGESCHLSGIQSQQHDRMVTVYGVVEAVRQLKSSGIQTGLVTSKNRQGALRGLALVGLEALMDVMVCADEVSNPKPHPEPVEKAVALLGAILRAPSTSATAFATCTRAEPPGSRQPRRSGGPSEDHIWRVPVRTTGWRSRRIWSA